MSVVPYNISVLVVHNNLVDAEFLSECLQSLSLSVHVATSGEKALWACEAFKPDIVLVDLYLSGMDSLTLIGQIHHRWPACPVVVSTGHSDAAAAVAALKIGAMDYLKQPILFEELRDTVNRAVALVRANRTDAFVSLSVEHLALGIRTIQACADVVPLVNLLVRDIEPLLKSQARFGIRTALHEMLLNAIEHGNLEITYQEKVAALSRNQYEDLLATRSQLPHLRDRRITMQMEFDRAAGRISYRISDEGPGFDWKTQMATESGSYAQAEGSGRGIFLTRSLVSDLTYNDRGNESILTLLLSEYGTTSETHVSIPREMHP